VDYTLTIDGSLRGFGDGPADHATEVLADEAVAFVQDWLENTLILFTSDNGILHGERRWTKKEAPYEGSIRVPLVMRWDAAGWTPGTRLPGVLALNIDLAPTIADAAGVPHPPTDGRSLLPLLGGERSSWRSDLLIEHMQGTNSIPTFCAVRSERWTYVRYSTGEEELDDLVADPFELENLVADPAMRPVLDDRRTRLRELCSPAPPGFGDRSGTSVPIALAVLGGLVLVESVASRRTRHPRRAPG
jgi:arylsulfatase A-like enzyme